MPRCLRLFWRLSMLLPAAGLGGPPAYGQGLLQDSVLTDRVLLNTVPDLGETAVSFLDYRATGYGVYLVDVATGLERKLLDVFYAEPEVATYGQRAAWIGYTPLGQPDVYVVDSVQVVDSLGFVDSTAVVAVPVTADAAFQNHPDLSADFLVWQDYRNAGTTGVNADLYLYDFAAGAERPVTTAAGYQDLPRVHDSLIVWQDYRHAGPLLDTAEIYALDLTTGLEMRITTGSAFRTHPAVWERLVVWEDYRNGDRGDIYLYDLSTGVERPVSTFPAHKTQPAVAGDWVVWQDYRNGPDQGDLYGVHLPTGLEYSLLVHPAHQEPPHLFDARAVWQDYRDGRLDLYIGTLVDPTPIAVEAEQPARSSRCEAFPNPFSASVTVTCGEAPASGLALSIYAVTGRLVWRQAAGAGRTRVTWDGRQTDGTRLAPGVYVGVVTGEGVRESVRLVYRPA